MTTPPINFILPDHPDFQPLLASSFNAVSNNQTPKAICRPNSVLQVIEAVIVAIKYKWRISIRSGGHSWARWHARDDALMIDLGGMKTIEALTLGEREKLGLHLLHNPSYRPPEAERVIVKVGAACTSRELNQFLAGFGSGNQMFPGGHHPDVGLGGFLLQGGMGWNTKNWGWACEYVLAADIVTADGFVIRCSRTENSDLFWALRGSGPTFPAIVTHFYMETRRSSVNSYESRYVYPITSYQEVLDWVMKISPGFDSDTEIVCISTFSNAVPIPEPVMVVKFTSFKSTHEEAELALRPAEDSRPVGVGVQSFCLRQSLFSEYAKQAVSNPRGVRHMADGIFIRDNLQPIVIQSFLRDVFTMLPSPGCYALYFPMHPTSKRLLPDMSLSVQSSHYVSVYAQWTDPKEDLVRSKWMSELFASLSNPARCVGGYLGDADFQRRTGTYWGDEQTMKLAGVRKKYDPSNRICQPLGLVEGFKIR